MSNYDFKAIEAKWQKHWLDNQVFKTPKPTTKRPKKYVLDEFPYPSGDGLHVGHVKIYTAADVAARYYRLKNYAVLHPTGWDAFGLPTENSAIKFNIHPAKLTERNTDRFRQQMQMMGFSYDWEREINTTDPDYYRWTQWIFLRLFERGLAYEATIPISWCPSCKTGLANEEVNDGFCARCGTAVEKKPLRQWLLKITAYADRLLAGLKELDWPEYIKDIQRNWIGRKEGINITYQIKGESEKITCFTTRPDTNFGATFIVLSPEHKFAQHIAQTNDQVAGYCQQAINKTDIERTAEGRKKTGVFTGYVALNNLTDREMPIWVSDFVLGHFGTGAVVGVPGHDKRDFEFAQEFGLPVIRVVVGTDGDQSDINQLAQVQEEEGTMINSDFLNGLNIHEATEKIKDYLAEKGWGQRVVTYSLRDWVFSRQRYWGEPIPLIHCEHCGIVPVPEKELPVKLPAVDKYEPTGTGESPLATIPSWVNTTCPKCGGAGKRETNTMPQWAGSSWYWLRFLDPKNKKELAARKKMEQWLPVDIYVGGAEHAVLHLLYARFWNMVLFDEGIVPQAEPFQKRHIVGLVLGVDGQKMSKSRPGSVINPDDVVEHYGADTLRVYEMFMGPFEAAVAWDTGAIAGAHRFLKRVHNLFHRVSQNPSPPPFTRGESVVNPPGKGDNRGFCGQVIGCENNFDTLSNEKAVNLKLHQTIQRVTEGVESFRFNTAIAALMELLNLLEEQSAVDQQVLTTYSILLSPFAPHLAEELWQNTGHKKSLWVNAQWPQYDKNLLAEAEITLPVQINGKLRGELIILPNLSSHEVELMAKNLPNIQRHLAAKKIARVVYIPGKMINFVVA